MNILILSNYREFPLRVAISDHLYSFRKYSSHKCFYLNLACQPVPRHITRTHFDLIIFHTTFLSARWSPVAFAQLLEKARALKRLKAVKVALPQDEFIHTDALCDFINEFGIDHVFTVASESKWPAIFRSVNSDRVRFFTVLTGYLDEGTIAKINRLATQQPPRIIDIGYRAWRGAAWLGRHGLLKAQVADVFQEKAPQSGLVTDISTREEDTILGDEWFKFMLRCKYVIGVEGGASILDPDGKIKERTEEYFKLHPQARFEEVEAACFPGLDGAFRHVVITPRHLEACATRTCQVLVEGRYNGILEAGRHYVELKRDFSNIQQVLDIIKEDRLRGELTERAYKDIVESGHYTYRSFVETVIGESLRAETGRVPFPRSALSTLFYYRTRVASAIMQLRWGYVNPLRGRLRIRTRLRSVLGTLPKPLLFLRRLLGRAGNL